MGLRHICYSVAASLDGFITGHSGEIDWILMDPDIDFASLTEPFDTIVMGRSTDLATRELGGPVPGMPGMRVVVCSTTLRPEQCPEAELTDDARELAAALRAEEGKDVWLFGGGVLCRNLLDAGLVDRVEVAIIPVLLGAGLPLVATAESRAPAALRLRGQRVYHKTSTVILEYDVDRVARSAASAPAGDDR